MCCNIILLLFFKCEGGTVNISLENENPGREKLSVVLPTIYAPDHNRISRAKMRSVYQTIVIVLAYVMCSTPFMVAQLFSVWGSPSQGICKFFGRLNKNGKNKFLFFLFSVDSTVWLFWLLTLNSVVNPWVYLAFNRELRAPLKKLFSRRMVPIDL